MRKIIFISVAVLLNMSLFSQTYQQQYSAECEEAIGFYRTHKAKFDAIALATGLDSRFLFSIVAPEVSQFSYLSNIAETYSLKVLYVQGGKNYSNFSIGYFQMKPSFVEGIEEFLKNNDNLKSKYQECFIKKDSERETRVERLKRLESIDWQFKYLSVFCDIVTYRFGNKEFDNDNEKLKFYAATYNSGFNKSKEHIEEMKEKSLFPHFSRNKYKYADIAVYFYENISKNKPAFNAKS
ncbi:hypothetical protein LJC11_00640 [Bacteroidales bacterium OttesenSCG-928-I21]|nr:hypothetical protein [Bacteroidales bacterium OttesenSCG-928-I21]